MTRSRGMSGRATPAAADAGGGYGGRLNCNLRSRQGEWRASPAMRSARPKPPLGMPPALARHSLTPACTRSAGHQTRAVNGSTARRVMQFRTASWGKQSSVATEARTEDGQLTLSCEVCGAQLGSGTDAYLVRRQIIGPGVTETIKGTWLCSRACALTYLRFRES